MRTKKRQPCVCCESMGVGTEMHFFFVREIGRGDGSIVALSHVLKEFSQAGVFTRGFGHVSNRLSLSPVRGLMVDALMK